MRQGNKNLEIFLFSYFSPPTHTLLKKHGLQTSVGDILFLLKEFREWGRGRVDRF